MTHFIEADSLLIEIPHNGVHIDNINKIVNNFTKNKYTIYDKIYLMLNDDEILQIKESDLEDLLGKPKYDITFNLLIFPKKLPNGKVIVVNTDEAFEKTKINID